MSIFYVNKEDLQNLKGVTTIINNEEFKLHLVKANTALVRNNAAFVETSEDLIKLLKTHRDYLVCEVARKCGVKEGTPVDVDLVTGTLCPRK